MHFLFRKQQTGSTERKDGSGRPHALENDEAESVVALAAVDPSLSSRKIRAELNIDVRILLILIFVKSEINICSYCDGFHRKALNFNVIVALNLSLFVFFKVSVQTIRNVLKEAGLRSSVAARKPALTPAQITGRLEFARRHENWTVADWSNVLFTDESCIQSYPNSKQRFYRPRCCRYLPEYIQPLARSGKVSVAVWSCFSVKKLGPLHFIDGRLNGESYCDILEHVMIPDALDNHFPDGCFLFQQVMNLYN